MASNLSRTVEYAEYLLQCSKEQPSLLLEKKSGDASSNKSKSIHQKLLDLYLEETEKQQDGKELDYATHLLAKLVKRDKLNCLIVNLYPANEGYSLMFKARNGIETETIKLPYEESELLEYIDEAQLPPFLVDLLEKSNLNVFYSGCVIVEVRDYRRSTSGSHDSQYVLLKPTSQSLLCDINAIMSENNIVTQEDEFALESELLLATEEPLCLDPSPAVCLINNKIQFEEKKLCSPDLKRIVKKYSQASVNRKRKLAQASAPNELKLFDFITQKKDKNRANHGMKLKMTKSCVDVWKQKNPVNLAAPSVIEVDKYAKVLEKPATGVEFPKIFVEEHTLEREPNQEKHMLARVTISRRSSDNTFYGELYLDYEYSIDKEDEGCSCQFLLGSRDEVDKYLEQFRQLFTEEGRRLVKITIRKQNLPPTTTYTQTQQGLNSNISITQAFLKQATGLTATLSSPGQSEVCGTGSLSSKRNMPIQLSLSIGHPLVTHSSNLISQPSTITYSTSIQQPNQLKVNAQQLPVLQTQTIQSQATTQKLKQPTLVNTPRMSSSIKVSIDSPATTSTNQPAASNSDTTISAPQPPNVGTNINITNIGGLSQNFNIQGLTAIPGMNITNLQGLQNMQVSLTGVTGGTIAVPISMINNNPSIIQNQTGLFVSSLPNLATNTSSAGQTQPTSSVISGQNTAVVASTSGMVTMVTGLPTSTVTPVMSSTTTASSHVIMSTGLTSNPTTVLPQSSSMLSLPIGLAQFLPVASKGQASTGLRATTASLPLLQLPGQQSIQLLNLPQQRAQLKSSVSHGHQNVGRSQVVPGTSVPISNVLTQSHLSISPLTVSKPSQQPQGTITAQQLRQLTGQAATNIQPAPQLSTQLAFQKPQQSQPLQFHHHLQVKPGTPIASQSKLKSKKRTTPTPPK